VDEAFSRKKDMKMVKAILDDVDKYFKENKEDNSKKNIWKKRNVKAKMKTVSDKARTLLESLSTEHLKTIAEIVSKSSGSIIFVEKY
jgi:hypothetical protein